jgi:hypothetical protein
MVKDTKERRWVFQKVTEGGKFNAQKEMGLGEQEVKTVGHTRISGERETGPTGALRSL